MVLGDENGSWGTITVNGDIFYRNDTGYRLFLENNDLHLQISNDFIAPDAPEIFADVKELTNGDVKITAVFADDSVLNECKIGDGIWKEYTGAILFTSNGTISFRSTDVFGNVHIFLINLQHGRAQHPAALMELTPWQDHEDETREPVDPKQQGLGRGKHSKRK